MVRENFSRAELADMPHEVEAAILATLPTAPGRRNKQVFELARALKAIPWLAEANAIDLLPHVREWHRRALPYIATKTADETLRDFVLGWPKVRFPKGADSMSAILERALSAQPPAEAEQFDSPQVLGLLALCRELQRAAGDGPFFLSCRTAGRLFDMDHTTAHRWLRYLTAVGLLREVVKGTHANGKATRWRYLGKL